MKGSENGEHLGKQATHSVNVKGRLVGIDICLPMLQSLEVAASQNVWTLSLFNSLEKTETPGNYVTWVQWAAGKPFRYPVPGALWDTLVIKETLVQFWIHKGFISEITRVQCGVWLPHGVDGGGSYSYAPIPLPLLRLYSPPQTHDNKASYVPQCRLLIASYLQVLWEIWSWNSVTWNKIWM